MAWLPDRLPAKPNILWRTPLNEIALAGVVATGKVVLVADRELDDTVDAWRCLDAATGKSRWAVRYPAPGGLDYGNSPRAAPLIDGDRVFLVGAQGHVHCVDLETGRLLWQRHARDEFGVTAEMPWGMCGSPLIVAGKLILHPGGPAASLVALDPATGKTLWTTPGRPASYGSLIAGKLGGKLQIVGHDQTTLGGWDPETGKRLWTLAAESDQDFNVPTPIIHRGRLLVTTESDGTRVYDFGKEGQILQEPRARFADLAPDTHTPVVAGDRLFGVSQWLYCLDLAADLKEVYHAKDDAFRDHTSLMATDDKLLVCSSTGELILLDTTTGALKVLGRLQVFEDEAGLLSHPALVGQKLYIRGSREIVCVDLGSREE